MSTWLDHPVSRRTVAGAAALATLLGLVPAAWVHARDRRPVEPQGPAPTRPELLIIPAPASRQVTLGSPANELGRGPDEDPRTAPLTQDYALSLTEVTQAQWRTVMGTEPAYFDPPRGGADDHPVERVSAFDAMAYLNRLSKLEGLDPCYELSPACTNRSPCPPGLTVCGESTGPVSSCRARPDCLGYRLPTEAEWETAAKAGSEGPFPPTGNLLGNPLQDIELVGWFMPNSVGREGVPCVGPQLEGKQQCGTTQRAADPSRIEVGWGFRDLIGNVREWVATDDPETPYVTKGCGWYDYRNDCRAARRKSEAPSTRDYGIGLRIARTFPKPAPRDPPKAPL